MVDADNGHGDEMRILVIVMVVIVTAIWLVIVLVQCGCYDIHNYYRSCCLSWKQM